MSDAELTIDHWDTVGLQKATTGVYRHSRAIGSTPKPAAACYEVQIATLDSPIDPVTSEQKAIAEPSSQPRRRPALPVPSD